MCYKGWNRYLSQFDVGFSDYISHYLPCTRLVSGKTSEDLPVHFTTKFTRYSDTTSIVSLGAGIQGNIG